MPTHPTPTSRRARRRLLRKRGRYGMRSLAVYVAGERVHPFAARQTARFDAQLTSLLTGCLFGGWWKVGRDSREDNATVFLRIPKAGAVAAGQSLGIYDTPLAAFLTTARVCKRINNMTGDDIRPCLTSQTRRQKRRGTPYAHMEDVPSLPRPKSRQLPNTLSAAEVGLILATKPDSTSQYRQSQSRSNHTNAGKGAMPSTCRYPDDGD